MIRVLARGGIAGAFLCVAITPAVAQVPVAAPPPASIGDLLGQARVHYDSTRYEEALPLLDRAIGSLVSSASRDAATRELLVSAYELRARSRWGIGDRDGARR